MPANEVHHAAPRCLLRLRDAADETLEGVGAWIEWEDEATRWGVPITIDRADLEALIERSTVVMERDKHRLIHQTDFQRWGRRGGQATLRKYGRTWYVALAKRRWNRIDPAALDAARMEF